MAMQGYELKQEKTMQSNFMNSEIGLADVFVGLHKDDLRYGCKEKRWFLRTPEGWNVCF